MNSPRILMQQAEKCLDAKLLQSGKGAIDEALTVDCVPGDRAIVLYEAAVYCLDELAAAVEAVRLFDQLVDLFDSHPTLKVQPDSRQLLAYTYENRMLLSLSYDEYDRWAAVLREMSPAEAILAGQVPLVHEQRDKGMPWSDVLQIIAASYYNRNNPRHDPGIYGRAVGIYDLLLENRRRLRLDRQEWSNVIYEYVALLQRLSNVAVHRMDESGTVYPDECRFYLENARRRMDDFLAANQPDEVITRLSNSIDEMLKMSSEMGPRGLAPAMPVPLQSGGSGQLGWDDYQAMRREHPELPGHGRLIQSCVTTLALIATLVYVIGKFFGWW